jgi:hypothetical protein
MTRSPHLFHDLLDLAAAIRADGTSTRFVSVTANAGRVHCAVTSGSNRPPDAAPDPHRASHPLFGAALQEAAAALTRELLDRRVGDLAETGGRGLVTISAEGAMRIDLRLSDGREIHEGVDLVRLRGAALSHPVNRALCLAAALSDDVRFPRWDDPTPVRKRSAGPEAQGRVQDVWMEAAKLIGAEAGPDQSGIGTAAMRLVTSFRPVDLDSDRLSKMIRTRLYPDLLAPILPDGPVPDRPEGLGSAPAWLPLDPLEAERLHAALEGSDDPVLSGVLAKLRVCLSDVSSDEVFRTAAVEKYAGRLTDGDLDFQPDGMVSKSDAGAYVMAFLWVTNAEAGLEQPEEDIDAEQTP